MSLLVKLVDETKASLQHVFSRLSTLISVTLLKLEFSAKGP